MKLMKEVEVFRVVELRDIPYVWTRRKSSFGELSCGVTYWGNLFSWDAYLRGFSMALEVPVPVMV